MTERTFDLTGVFKATTKRMLAEFDGVRSATSHPTTRGDGSEKDWRDTLSRFLPHRYAVNAAIVVDSRGRQSDQIDIVIHDRHFSPTLYNTMDTLFVPAECVYAVLEVKPEINKPMINYAGAKAASVRQLHRTSLPIQRLGQDPSAVEPKPILAGIVATRCSWTQRFGPSLVESLRDLEPDRRLDLGCALHAGMFEVPSGRDAEAAEVSGVDVGLAMFAMRLVARLNQVGTVPALDYDAYTAALLQAVPED